MFVSSHVRSTSRRPSAREGQRLPKHLRGDAAASEGRHGVVADMPPFDTKRVGELVMDGYPPHEVPLRDGPQVGFGEVGTAASACVGELLRHERAEVLLGDLGIASDPPGETFVAKLTKPTQEALSVRFGR